MDLNDLFLLPDGPQMMRVVARVVTAALLGALLGAEREAAGKAAGLRTHMLVAIGAALFVLFPAEAGMELADLSRVIQGVATGIGFIGAGTILKRGDLEIQGLTTAASVWLTGAIGMSVGAGQLWISVVCAFAAWVILFLVARLELRRS
jgi:putative Mg2+ transporter-C (MgtC) family protein